MSEDKCCCCEADDMAHRLTDALLPFGLAIMQDDWPKAHDEAFIWEPDGDKPLVTFGALRNAWKVLSELFPEQSRNALEERKRWDRP